MIEKAYLERIIKTLFPIAPFTRYAYDRTMGYINTTIEVVGVVESMMFMLRDNNAIGNEISDVYFPKQTCGSDGVSVDADKILEAGKETRDHSTMCGWIHHHMYGVLRPSGPTFPPWNDKDNNRDLLAMVGAVNNRSTQFNLGLYREYLEIKRERREDKIAELKRGPVMPVTQAVRAPEGGSVTTSVFAQSPSRTEPYGVYDSTYEAMLRGQAMTAQRYLDDWKVFDEFGDGDITLRIGYLYCVIMNPTVEPKNLFGKGRKKYMRMFGQSSEFPPKKSYQNNVFEDPYVEIAYEISSPDIEIPQNHRTLRLPIGVLTDGEAKAVNYDAIREEVIAKTKKGLVQFFSIPWGKGRGGYNV